MSPYHCSFFIFCQLGVCVFYVYLGVVYVFDLPVLSAPVVSSRRMQPPQLSASSSEAWPGCLKDQLHCNGFSNYNK